MKPQSMILFASILVALASCENPVIMQTKVNEDGSLNKTIILEKTDKGRSTNNMFGISEATGWNVTVEELPKDTADKSGDSQEKYLIQFKKDFRSADDVNAELDRDIDTLFQVHARFEKKFRWFYTYLRYSETVRPIDRFKRVSPEDYFNQEDNAFVDRLPGEGTAISKADSVFLETLTEKINDRYANVGIFNERYETIAEVIRRNGLDDKWLDTLRHYRNDVYEFVDEMQGDKDFAEKMADSLKIPLPKPESSADFAELSRDLNARIDFMSFANDGKYTFEVEMPWDVVAHNADSAAGNILYWRPLVTKFAYREYTLFAESRRMNLVTTALSVVIVGLTLLLFVRGRRSSVP